MKYTHKFQAGEVIITHRVLMVWPLPLDWNNSIDLAPGNKVLVDRINIDSMGRPLANPKKDVHYIRIYCNGRPYHVSADELLHCCKAIKS